MITGRDKQPGFTLLELLVVLALIAFMTGLTAPRLFNHMQARQLAEERRSIVDQLLALRQRIQLNGWALTLDAKTLASELPDKTPAIQLPEGWSIEINEPIRFGFNGVCSGGDLNFIHVNGQALLLRLTAPGCWIEQPGEPN